MNYTALRRILSIALLNVALVIYAPAQSSMNDGAKLAQAEQRTTGGSKDSIPGRSKVADVNKSDDKTKLTGAEAQLVAGSKQAIVETGISEPYFKQHFQLIKVTNQPGDRRIIWKYSINEYEATLNDAVGYYSAGDGQRVNTHSIKQILGSAHDIEKTISRNQAERIMKRCIGKFTTPSIVFRPLAVSEKTSLYMMASSVSKNRDGAEKREEEKRKKESEKRASKNKTAQLDMLREEGDEGEKPSYFGMVNLETGKCTKGKAIVAP